jgi:hypothetical protein
MMDKRLSNINHKKTHRKQKIEQHQPQKNEYELGFSGIISSSCSTSGTRRTTLVEHKVISNEREKKDCIVTLINGRYLWLFMTQIIHNQASLCITKENPTNILILLRLPHSLNMKNSC